MSKIVGLNRHPQDQFRTALNALVTQAMNDFGVGPVVRDLGRIAGGLLAAHSQRPQRDLDLLAAGIRQINWRQEKRMWRAAQLGVDPDDVPDEVGSPEGQEEARADAPD